MDTSDATKLIKDDKAFDKIKDKAVSYKNGAIAGAVAGLFAGLIVKTGKTIWWVIGGGLLGGFIALKVIEQDSKVSDASKFTLIDSEQEKNTQEGQDEEKVNNKN